MKKEAQAIDDFMAFLMALDRHLGTLEEFKAKILEDLPAQRRRLMDDPESVQVIMWFIKQYKAIREWA